MRFSLEIMSAHGRECPYCGTIMRVDPSKRASQKPYFPTRDHVTPKAVQPGSMKVIVCRQCNGDKGSKTLDQWASILGQISDPRANRVASLVSMPIMRDRTECGTWQAVHNG
jgi:hypothetical protein